MAVRIQRLGCVGASCDENKECPVLFVLLFLGLSGGRNLVRVLALNRVCLLVRLQLLAGLKATQIIPDGGVDYCHAIVSNG